MAIKRNGQPIQPNERFNMSVDVKSYSVGSAAVTRVKELDLAGIAMGTYFPDWEPSAIVDHPNWVAPETMDATGALRSVHTWVVRDGHRTILIDTSAGNDKDRPNSLIFDHLKTPFLDRLRDAGVEPKDVDYVLMTHLHIDHVGWNTRLEGGRWVPTFPNAQYIFSRAEHEYFTDLKNLTERNKTSFMVLKDSVDPVIEAGLAHMIDVDGSEPIAGFTFFSTPGHTPAHASIVFRSGGEVALFAGDVLHHPLQVYRPDWNSLYDLSKEGAIKSRKWALQFAVDNKATLFSSHFPATSAGRVDWDGTRFQWRFF